MFFWSYWLVTLQVIVNALSYCPEFDGEDPIVLEDTTFLSHRTWSNQVGSQLKFYSYWLVSYHAPKEKSNQLYINSANYNNNQCPARCAYGCKQHGSNQLHCYSGWDTEHKPDQILAWRGEEQNLISGKGKAESVFFKTIAPSKAPLEDHKSKNVWGSTNWFWKD